MDEMDKERLAGISNSERIFVYMKSWLNNFLHDVLVKAKFISIVKNSIICPVHQWEKENTNLQNPFVSLDNPKCNTTWIWILDGMHGRYIKYMEYTYPVYLSPL